MGTKEEKKEVTPLKNHVKPYGKVLLTLKNQLLPEEKLAITPSQNDGLSMDAETDLRIHGCELIQTAGILLRLPQVGSLWHSTKNRENILGPPVTVSLNLKSAYPRTVINAGFGRLLLGRNGHGAGASAKVLLLKKPCEAPC